MRIPFKTAQRRYMIAWTLTIAAFAVIYGIGMYFRTSSQPSTSELMTGFAIASTLPFGFGFWVLFRFVARADDYWREQMLWGLAIVGATLSFALLLIGFLQVFSLMGSVDTLFFGLMFFIVMGVGFAIGRRIMDRRGRT